MTTALIPNFDLLATAPGGVERLRKLILTLAVQGKLVPQDPSDEPANELLKAIQAEKERLIAAREIKRSQLPTPVSEDATPCSLPTGWAWVRLSDLGEFSSGKTPSTQRPEYWNGNIPWITPKDMKRPRLSDSEDRVTEIAVREGLGLIPAQSVLVVVRSGILRRMVPTAINEVETTINQDLKALALFLPRIASYVQLIIQGFEKFILANLTKVGTTVESIQFDAFASQAFPLPPLAEQSRIITRVEELMRLCDALENQRQLEDAQHAQLLTTLLGTLTDSTSPDELAANWQRVSDHFDLLLDRPEAVDALEQTILQLAVRGLLVPQDLCDEPASVLNEKIISKRSQTTGKVKVDSILAPVGDKDKPFRIPENWEWCRVGHLVSIKHGYAFSSSHFLESFGPFVLTTPGNFFETGGFKDRGNRTKYYNGPVPEDFTLCPGDLIIAMTEQAEGLLGSAAFIPNDGKIYLHNQRLGKLSFDRELLVPEYVFYFFNGRDLRTSVADSSTGMKVKHTSPEKVGRALFPLPPFPEQVRIAAKVDELLALCRRLKSTLWAAKTSQQNLAEALVEI